VVPCRAWPSRLSLGFVRRPTMPMAPFLAPPDAATVQRLTLFAQRARCMPSGGRLVIETANVALDETYVCHES
jgi:hypothetical protein